MTSTEQVPTTWDTDRDEPFFRLVAHVLPCSVLEAASSLLASYDDEVAPAAPAPVAAPAVVPVPVQRVEVRRSAS